MNEEHTSFQRPEVKKDIRIIFTYRHYLYPSESFMTAYTFNLKQLEICYNFKMQNHNI